MNDLSTLSGTEIQEGQFRDIHTITTEIRVLYQEGTRMELSYAIRIGRRLKEAKELLEHGEWGEWCENNLPFSQSKANKLMAVHEKFGTDQESLFGDSNSETFTNLGLSQAFALLSLPDEEWENFVRENDVESLSVRELKKKIDEANAERDALKTRAEALDADNRMLRQSNIDFNKKIQDAEAEVKKAQEAASETEKAKKEKEAAEERAKVAQKNEQAAKEKLAEAVTKEQEARAALAEAKANPEIPEEKLKELERDAAEKAKKAAEDFSMKDSGWFYISGTPGSGKSHICAAICKELIERGKEVRYMMWRDDATKLKAVINEPEYEAQMRKLKSVDVLYIDDFFKGNVTAADVNLAFELLNARYNDSRLRTIISSERDLNDVIGIDEAVGSRIYERSKSYCKKSPAENWRLK